MPLINIPKGFQISHSQHELNELNELSSIRIKIKDTRFWIIGEQKPDNLWDIYILDPLNNFKELIKENKTTKSFGAFSNIVLKTPFPYQEKTDNITSEIINNFIKKITKNIK